MEDIKKKGNAIKKLAAVMWFVFCVLSFLFLVNTKSYAEIITYKYTFNLGSGNVRDKQTFEFKSIPSIKLVLTVEEDTDKAVTDTTRYNIVDYEMTGYENYAYLVDVSNGVKYCREDIEKKLGFSLSDKSNISIYHVMSYASFASKGDASRKPMKALLFAIQECAGQVCVEENGTRDYIKYEPNFNGDDSGTKDNHFSGFVWLYDRKWGDVDFKGEFDNGDTNCTPYNPKYIDKMSVVVNGTQSPLVDMLGSDINMLKVINQAIESNSSVGSYLKGMKTVYKVGEDIPDGVNETYCWWYQEGSYNQAENSILVDCGKTKGTADFTFKYSPTGDLIESITQAKIKTSTKGNYDYALVNDDSQTNDYNVHPDYTNGTHHTSAEYFYTNGRKITITKTMHLAIDSMSNAGVNKGYIRVTKFYDIPEISHDTYGKIVVSIPKEELNKIIEELGGDINLDGMLIKKNNGYVFALDLTDNTVAFFKENDPAYKGINMKFQNFYSIYYDNDNKQYGLSPKADPRGKFEKNHVTYQTDVDHAHQYKFPTLRSNKTPVDQKGNEFEWSWGTSMRFDTMLYDLVKDPDYDCFLSVYDTTNISIDTNGTTSAKTIKRSEVELLAEVSVRDWLLKIYGDKVKDIEEQIKMERTPGIGGYIRTNEIMRSELKDFLTVLAKYIKPLFMFLVFISLVLAALYSIADNQNAEKRVLLKIRIKNIVLGCLAFALVFLIICVASYYFDEAASELNSTASTFDYDLNGSFSGTDDWIVLVVRDLINAIASAIEWIVNFIGTRMLLLDKREINIANAIFDVEEGGGLTLYPFTEVEWTIFMYGYKLLTTITICLVALALVKNIAVVILQAGNTEKELEVREDFLRIVVAIVCVVLVPYAFRLLLLLVNSLVKLIPVSESKFDLDFSGFGLLGAVARIYYAWLQLKIYAIFAVRKVMLAFMLISTPVIFGIWAFSKQFRSFDLWLGELTTNAFTIISYAFTFFFLVVILSSESNPFAVLLLLKMMLQLGDFVKDSLQGLFNAWGGINETHVAESALDQVKSSGTKMLNIANNVKTRSGRFINNAANFIDKDGVSTGGHVARTAAGIISGDYRRALLSGNWNQIRTKKDLMNARRNLVKDEASSKRNIAEEYKDKLNLSSKEINDLYLKYENGTLTKEDIDKLQHGKGSDYSNLNSYIENNEEAKHLEQTYERLEETVNNTRGILSSLQDSGTQKIVDSYIEKYKDQPATSIYDEMKKDYKNEVLDMQKTYQEYQDAGSNTELRKEKQEHLEHLIGDIVNDSLALSEIALDIDLDLSDIDIAGGQKQAMQIAVKGFDRYDFDNVDKAQEVKDNIKKLNERNSAPKPRKK